MRAGPGTGRGDLPVLFRELQPPRCQWLFWKMPSSWQCQLKLMSALQDGTPFPKLLWEQNRTLTKERARETGSTKLTFFLSRSPALLVRLAIREWITSIPLKQCTDQEKGVGIINGKILESFSPVAWLQLQGKQDTTLNMGRRKRKGAETLTIYRDWLARKNKVAVVNRHSCPELPGEKRTRTIAVCTGCK